MENHATVKHEPYYLWNLSPGPQHLPGHWDLWTVLTGKCLYHRPLPFPQFIVLSVHSFCVNRAEMVSIVPRTEAFV